MTPVNRVHHTGMVVRSLNDAYAYYRDALGLRLLKEEMIQDQGVRAALFDLGNSLLELLEPVEPDTGIARFLERRGEGLHHVCLEVNDIRGALAGLKTHGVRLIDEAPREGLVGTIAFLHPSALNGVLVELVEAAGSSPADGDPPGAAGAGTRSQRLDHVVLAVQELAQAAVAWGEVFGLQAEHTYRPEGTDMELALLPVGEPDQLSAFLELVQATAADHRVARFIDERGQGMFSIAIQVDDLDTAAGELRTKGVDIAQPEVGPLPDTRVARIPPEAAHGVPMQLIERKRP